MLTAGGTSKRNRANCDVRQPKAKDIFLGQAEAQTIAENTILPPKNNRQQHC